MNSNWELYRLFLKMHPDGGTPQEIYQFARANGATFNAASDELRLWSTKSNLNIMLLNGEIRKSGEKYHL